MSRHAHLRNDTFWITYGTLVVCFFLCVSACQTWADKSQKDENIGRNENRQDSQTSKKPDELLDPELVEALSKNQIIKPFAWHAWSNNGDKGEIIGFDKTEKLRRLNYTKTINGYVIEPAFSPPLRNSKYDLLIKSSGNLNLVNYLTEREAPSKSDIITIGDCNVHFILVWYALNRSLHSTDPVAIGSAIRIIVEKDSKVISNDFQDMDILQPSDAENMDVNGDGKQDFIFIGNFVADELYIWTVEPDCSVNPLFFEAKGGVMEKSISDTEIVLKRDQSSAGYTIHARSFERGIRSVPPGNNGYQDETVYKWNKEIKAFRTIQSTHKPIKK